MLTATTQNLIDWSRQYVPDPKTRAQTVRSEEIGRTSLPTVQRETFYLKRPATGSVFLYVDPYSYSASSTLNSLAATDKKFLYNATLQSCTFPAATDPSIRPAQFKAVESDYEYSKRVLFSYSDTELVEFLPAAIAYLNNNYSTSYSYTGTISTFAPDFTNDSDTDIVSRSLAVIVRNNFVAEQMRAGLGVNFRGPMAAIDSKTQLNTYNKDTAKLEKSISDKIENDKTGATDGSGAVIDIYAEEIVDD